MGDKVRMVRRGKEIFVDKAILRFRRRRKKEAKKLAIEKRKEAQKKQEYANIMGAWHAAPINQFSGAVELLKSQFNLNNGLNLKPARSRK